SRQFPRPARWYSASIHWRAGSAPGPALADIGSLPLQADVAACSHSCSTAEPRLLLLETQSQLAVTPAALAHSLCHGDCPATTGDHTLCEISSEPQDWLSKLPYPDCFHRNPRRSGRY